MRECEWGARRLEGVRDGASSAQGRRAKAILKLPVNDSSDNFDLINFGGLVAGKLFAHVTDARDQCVMGSQSRKRAPVNHDLQEHLAHRR